MTDDPWLSYLNKVESIFYASQPQIFNDFLDIIEEFKSQSFDSIELKAAVSQLFSGHPELIVQFDAFLSEEESTSGTF